MKPKKRGVEGRFKGEGRVGEQKDIGGNGIKRPVCEHTLGMIVGGLLLRPAQKSLFIRILALF